MKNTNELNTNEQKLMADAKKRVALKLSFKCHLISYICVNLLLVIIYFLTSGSSESHFWPIYPILGWGLGLLTHGISTYCILSFGKNMQKKMEDKINLEFEYLKKN